MRLTTRVALFVFAVLTVTIPAQAAKSSPPLDFGQWPIASTADRTDTLIVEATRDSAWISMVRGVRSVQFTPISKWDREAGWLMTDWDTRNEFVPGKVDATGRDAGVIFGTQLDPDPDVGRKPMIDVDATSCAATYFLSIAQRLILFEEPIDATHVRIVARHQVVGLPRGSASAITLRSGGATERSVFLAIRIELGWN